MKCLTYILAVALAGVVYGGVFQGVLVAPASAQRGRVIQIEALKVEGRIQKPEAFYILQRSQLNFKGLEPKKSFIPMILKSVERDPF